MKLFKNLIIVFTFLIIILNCNPNAISLNNDEKEKKERENLLLLGLLVLSQDQAITTYTGSMNYEHAEHTATLLNNGKVLIVGNGVELYDPKTGTFSIVEEPSNFAVRSHKSVLLNSGKVLIVGGQNFYDKKPSLSSSVKLYDPNSNTVSDTGSLITQRAYFAATLLNNSKVLIAGGQYISDTVVISTLSDAELYDPGTGTFTSTGSLNTASLIDRGILLDNGKVLLSYTLELYNPDAGTFAKSSVNTSGVSYDTLVLLDNGKILVHKYVTSDAKFQLLTYDPNSDTLSNTDQYTTTFNFSSFAKLNNGKIFLPGGTYSSISSFSVHKQIEVFDPDEEELSNIGNMNTPRFGHTTTVLQDGRVLITGGSNSQNSFNQGNYLSTAEIYSP